MDSSPIAFHFEASPVRLPSKCAALIRLRARLRVLMSSCGRLVLNTTTNIFMHADAYIPLGERKLLNGSDVADVVAAAATQPTRRRYGSNIGWCNFKSSGCRLWNLQLPAVENLL